jgi:hypothetical protein
MAVVGSANAYKTVILCVCAAVDQASAPQKDVNAPQSLLINSDTNN